MGKGRKLRWNILVVLAAAAFLLFLGFIVLMVWGVRWMGGQKDFRRELADSIGDSVLEGVTATGPAGDIDLTPREFELMACLMKNAGKVVSREELLRDAWGWEYLTETKTVDTHIKRLRDKIEQAGYDPGLVETVRGYGYRFKL